jgi:DNA topoisomerase IB
VTDPQTIARIRDLVIPPAWEEVWICPYPMGHIQAVGTDAAGRKQYLYHTRWRERQDQKKFDHMLEFARSLPKMRHACAEHLKEEGFARERVLGCGVRLLDRGFFRVGSEGYAEQNETYGLATMLKRHVQVDGDIISFDFTAKGGVQRFQSVVDEDVAEVVAMLKRRRGGGPELLAYKASGRWFDVKSADINEYLKLVTGGDYTAKDFRTWNATVLAAVALAVSANASRTKTARKRAMSRAVQEVAEYLGNTPAIARSSYIDSRVFDRYSSGWTIAGALEDLGIDDEYGGPAFQGPIEEAVLDLLENKRDSDAVEKTA